MDNLEQGLERMLDATLRAKRAPANNPMGWRVYSPIWIPHHCNRKRG